MYIMNVHKRKAIWVLLQNYIQVPKKFLQRLVFCVFDVITTVNLTAKRYSWAKRTKNVT